MGVHRPIIKRIAVMMSAAELAEDNVSGLLTSVRTSWQITVNPINERISRSPVPGQPRAKLENERRKKHLRMEVNFGTKTDESPKRGGLVGLFRVMRL